MADLRCCRLSGLRSTLPCVFDSCFHEVNGPLREQTNIILVRCVRERILSSQLHPDFSDGIAWRSLSRLAKGNRLKRVRSMEKRCGPWRIVKAGGW